MFYPCPIQEAFNTMSLRRQNATPCGEAQRPAPSLTLQKVLQVGANANAQLPNFANVKAVERDHLNPPQWIFDVQDYMLIFGKFEPYSTPGATASMIVTEVNPETNNELNKHVFQSFSGTTAGKVFHGRGQGNARFQFSTNEAPYLKPFPSSSAGIRSELTIILSDVFKVMARGTRFYSPQPLMQKYEHDALAETIETIATMVLSVTEVASVEQYTFHIKAAKHGSEYKFMWEQHDNEALNKGMPYKTPSLGYIELSHKWFAVLS